jgi:hypothetical protein
MWQLIKTLQNFIGLAYQCKDIVFRLVIEYIVAYGILHNTQCYIYYYYIGNYAPAICDPENDCEFWTFCVFLKQFFIKQERDLKERVMVVSKLQKFRVKNNFISKLSFKEKQKP